MSNFDPFGNKPMAPYQQPMGGMMMQGQQSGVGMGNNINTSNNMMMQPPMGSIPLNSSSSMMGGPGFSPPPLATNPNTNLRSGSISTMMQPQNIGLNLNNNSYQDPNKQKTSLDSLGSW